MTKDRETPYLHYVCVGLCKKGRKADHGGYCQHCNKYYPRARVQHLNKKKAVLDKIKRNERY